MKAQAGAVNRQGLCARGEGSVKAAALSTEATTPAVISQGSGRAQATAQSEVQWLGLETLNWGAGTLVTASLGAGQLRERWQQSWTRGATALGASGTAGRGRM